MQHPSKFLILIADDDGASRNAIVRALAKHGYRTMETADSTQAAWLSVHTHMEHIHLLITNITIPPLMDGNRLANRLRQRLPDLKVLFVSSLCQIKEFPPSAVNYSDVLLKPVNLKLLIEQVRARLDS